MSTERLRLLIAFTGLFCLVGCTGPGYSLSERRLFSEQIPKSKVESVKNTITANGYERVGKEDYPYEGAITTLYQKEIRDGGTIGRIRILLSFKEASANGVSYRNLGITVVGLDHTNILVIEAEVSRMEDLLYETLLSAAGKENVVRGDRKGTAPQKPGFYAPYVGRPPPR